MYLKEIAFKEVEWILLAQDRTSGALLSARWWSFWFHNKWRISCSV